jgi:hypothetical protein
MLASDFPVEPKFEAAFRDPYLVKSVRHGSQLLRDFRVSGEVPPLREIGGVYAL